MYKLYYSIDNMATTIQISEELQKVLKERRVYEKEAYEEVIWDLLEDTMEFSEQTKKDIEEARKQIKDGKTHTIEEIKKELRL